MSTWKKRKQTAQKVGYKTVITKHFVMPDGTAQEYTTWGKPGGRNVAVVALTPENKVVVARQYRPGPERILDELPGGGAEEGEDLALAAARELREETGFVSDEPLIAIGSACRDAYTNETNYYFLARNCYRLGDQQLDETEFIVVDVITIEQLIENAKQARMSDAAAVLMALAAIGTSGIAAARNVKGGPYGI